MKTITLLLVLGFLVGSLGFCAADDPDIESLRAIPERPFEDTHFDIYVYAEDHDGLDKIKLYVDGNLKDTEDCDDDDVCKAYFDVYERESGYHTYMVKVYDVNGSYEKDSIEVFVKPQGSPYEDLPQLSGYFSPQQVLTGQPFKIYATAIDSDGIYKMEVLQGQTILGTQYCGGVTTCSRNFAISPRYTVSNYNFDIKAYDNQDLVSMTRVGVYIGQAAYCGDNACNNGETCSSCSQDCGTCNYCGNGVCSSEETCSSCSQDCGECARPVVVYTCGQLGGVCCSNGGSGQIGGSADCPSTCFSRCNAVPEPEEVTPTKSTPTGGVVVVDTQTAIMGLMGLMLLVLIAIAIKVK